MTDRIVGYTITLDKDMREDDAENILSAICMLKGVLSVTPTKGDPMGQMIAQRVKREVITALLALLQ